MTFRTSVFAAFVAAGFAFSPAAIARNSHHDIDEMTDEELTEAKEGIEEGLEEINESQEEIAERRDDEDTGKIESAALGVAEEALEAAEEALEEVLEEIVEEQQSRK